MDSKGHQEEELATYLQAIHIYTATESRSELERDRKVLGGEERGKGENRSGDRGRREVGV